MSGFITELRQRNVLRVGAAYLVVSWLILQFIDVVFPMLGLDEALGRPVLILLLLGLPVASILAWVFEMTPQGIKKEKDVDRSQPATEQTGRLLDRAIIVILMLTIGLLLFDKFVLQQPAPQQPVAEAPGLKSVAVLPFVNLSGKQEDEYFSDGLTETLLHMLSQLQGLRVAARTSAFSFKGKDADVRDIARSLGVATILEGSVQRSGGKVRITAQLIEAQTGFHLWSQAFDRDLDDIFLVQDEIAANVADALQLTLLADTVADMDYLASLGTKDTKAYDKYLLGLEQKNIASYGSLSRAEGLFKEALSLDPDFRAAKVELAVTYGLQAETGILTEDQAATKIRPLLDQVLQVNPEDGRSLGMLAGIAWQNAVRTYGPNSDQTNEAEASLRHAVELAPNVPLLYYALSNIATASRRNDEALEWLDKGLAVDPLSARLHLLRGRLLLGLLDRPQEAEEAFAKGRGISPEWTALNIASGDAALAQNHFAEGINWYQRAMSLDPQDHELPANISRFYYALGLQDEGDEMLWRAQALAPQEPWTRGLELEKYLRADSYERAAILAEGMVRDSVENRGDAFEIAVVGYVSSMIELGKADAVASFFESLKPGISGIEYVPMGRKEGTMRLVLVQALVQMGSFETANSILDSLMARMDTAGTDWRDNNYVMATIAAAQGDRESAIDYALKDFDQPLGRQMGWSFAYQHVAWLKPLLKDARVAKRIAELELETQAAGDEVRLMLMQQRAEKN
jgi:TolB-like protein/Tfp pilus assembly protein PilF